MDPAATELLIRLLSKHQDDLFRYILAQIPHAEDARDVLQECCVALCRKWGEFDPARPFLPWAFRFASIEVLKFRERASGRIPCFDEQLLELIARERVEQDTLLHFRLQALDLCLARLDPSDRELIRQRYWSGESTQELIQSSGESRRTVFRHLDRIRRQLQECISRTVGRE